MDRDRREALTLNVKLDKNYVVDFGEDLDVDRANINEELADQPSKFAWHGVLSELAKSKVLMLKNELETLKAELDQDIRSKADKKPTERDIDAMIQLDSKYQKKEREYLAAQKDSGILQVARQAFEQRKDMLISIAANMRGESDVNLKINKEKVVEKLKRRMKEREE